MAEWKEISKEEAAALNKEDVVVAAKAEDVEVEGQGVCRCPVCGAVLTVPGTPPYVTCCVCWRTFHVTWY